MSLRDRLTLPQRIVIVVALGFAMRVLQWWLLEDHDLRDGWFNYAPNSGLAYSPANRFSPVVFGLGSLALLAAWCVASVWLLAMRPKTEDPDDRDQSPPHV